MFQFGKSVDVKRWTLAFARVTAGVLGLSCVSVLAQDAEQSRLDTVERDLKRGESERDKLFQQQQDVTRDLDTVRRDLVKLARDIQDQEYSLLVLENRLTDLEKEEDVLQVRLGARDEQMGRVLLALERLALRPGDALSLSPLNPADAVRTAILLRAAVPSVRTSAQELQTELAELFAVRAQMTEQKEKIALGASALVDRRAELERLEQERAGKQTQLAAATGEATLRLEQMAREAEDLRELLEKLNAEKKRRQEEERLKAEAAAKAKAETEAAEAAKRAKELAEKPPESRALPTPPPPAPNLAPLVAELRPFSEARGSMPFPVAGTVSQLYGDSDASTGLSSRGLSIKSRPSAPVIAPFDGVVAFAGPFRAYGLLLIIEHSEGYHTLLAGLGRVDAAVGQRVLAGEPVGSMDNEGTPSLYVELRRDGQPVNPLPWLASRTGKKSG
jgi:septal ring factor EnvC (AmiA/AmiB activator)